MIIIELVVIKITQNYYYNKNHLNDFVINWDYYDRNRMEYFRISFFISLHFWGIFEFCINIIIIKHYSNELNWFLLTCLLHRYF